MKIDLLQSLSRPSFECTIEAVWQEGQRYRPRCCSFPNVEFGQKPFSLVGNVVGLRDGINGIKIQNFEHENRNSGS